MPFERLKRKSILVLIAAAAAASACATDDEPEREELTVAVSVLPQKHFVERIADGRVSVFVVVPPGASPATYEPTPSDMRTMADAAVWFTVGVPFETPWVPRFTGSLPGLRVVSTVRDIELLPIGRYSVRAIADGHHGHSHSEGSADPHVWLSPELVRSQASLIAGELSSLDPAGSDTYHENLERFLEDIDSLQTGIHSLLDTLENRTFMVFHPAWGYFADEFDLIQVPVESGGSEPSPSEMSMLVDLAAAEGIRVIFVSPQFSTSSASAIASETGGEVVEIDPLAVDWSENMHRVASALAEAASR